MSKRRAVEKALYDALMDGYKKESYGLPADYHNEAFRLRQGANKLVEVGYVNYASELFALADAMDEASRVELESMEHKEAADEVR